MKVTLLRNIVIFVILTTAFSPVLAEKATTNWYYCVARAASHTGRYTFKISTRPCAVYWLEIDTALKIRDCKLPVIAALKPSATDNYSIVWFNMETGRFYDYLSGVKDRGICKPIADPTK